MLVCMEIVLVCSKYMCTCGSGLDAQHIFISHDNIHYVSMNCTVLHNVYRPSYCQKLGFKIQIIDTNFQERVFSLQHVLFVTCLEL